MYSELGVLALGRVAISPRGLLKKRVDAFVFSTLLIAPKDSRAEKVTVFRPLVVALSMADWSRDVASLDALISVAMVPSRSACFVAISTNLPHFTQTVSS